MGKTRIILVMCLMGAILFGHELNAKKRSGNPILQGWYADPEGMIFGDRYWIFPTYSSLYENQIFLDAFSSRDLVNWEKHPKVIDNAEVKWLKYAMWAPAVVEKDGKYYLFFAGNDILNNDQVGGIGVAVADKPEGPYKDLLGKPLIDKIVNGAQPIDQYVFRDKDGTWLMYYGGWGHCNVVKLKDDFTGIVPFDDGTLYKEVTPKNYTEGPFMFIRDGKYYFMWSEGGWGSPDYSVSYAISDSPYGPFKSEAKILQQDPEVATSAGHNSVIHDTRSDRYYIVYHRRPLNETGRDSRATCIDEMFFDENGKILPVKMTFEGVEANKLKKKRK